MNETMEQLLKIEKQIECQNIMLEMYKNLYGVSRSQAGIDNFQEEINQLWVKHMKIYNIIERVVI